MSEACESSRFCCSLKTGYKPGLNRCRAPRHIFGRFYSMFIAALANWNSKLLHYLAGLCQKLENQVDFVVRWNGGRYKPGLNRCRVHKLFSKGFYSMIHAALGSWILNYSIVLVSQKLRIQTEFCFASGSRKPRQNRSSSDADFHRSMISAENCTSWIVQKSRLGCNIHPGPG